MKKIISLFLSLSFVISLFNSAVVYAAETEYDYFIEAEKYTSSNWRSSGGSRVQDNKDCSNMKYLNLYYPLDESGEYYAEYEVDVETAGVYQLDIAITPMKTGWTSAVNVSVNGGELQKLTGTQFAVVSSDRGINWYRADTIILKEGSNIIRFVVNEHISSGERAVCFMDCFGLTLSKFQIKEITSPAPFQTFQQGEDLRFEIVGKGIAPNDISVAYDVLDYEGRYIDGGNAVIKKDSKSVEIVLPSKKKGAYQIVANCGGNSTFQQFLVVTNLKDRKKYEDTPFGFDALMYGQMVNRNSALIEEFADMIELTGVSWTRDRVYFNTGNYVTKNGNKYSFSLPYTEKTGQLLADRGIKTKMVYDVAPKVITQGDYGDTTPTNLFDVYYLYKQMAERYDGTVNCWELGNELDLGGGASNKDGPDTYASFFKAAALGIIDSKTDAEVLVSPYGAASGPTHSSEQIQLLAENDIYDYTDIVNYHNHQGASEPYKSYYEYTGDNKLDAYRELEEKHDLKWSKWNGESGFYIEIPSNKDHDAEEQMIQANFLVTSFVEDLAAGTDKKFWFCGVTRNEGQKSWGATSRSSTATSAYASMGALSAMTHILGEGVFAGELKNMPDGVNAYAFRDGNDTAIVYYSTSESGEKYNIELNVGKGAVRKFDIFANESKLYSQSGKYSLVAESYPQYVKFSGTLEPNTLDEVRDEFVSTGLKQKNVDDSKRVILLQKYGNSERANARLNGYQLSDEKHGIDIDVYNFNDYTVRGNIHGKSAGGWGIEPTVQPVEIAPMSYVTVHFDVLPEPFESQEDRLTFYGDMSCGVTTESVARVKGAKVIDVQPKIENDEKFVTVRINNTSDTQQTVESATIVVNNNTVEFDERITVEPETEKSFDVKIDFGEDSNVLDVSVDVKFESGNEGHYKGSTPFAIASYGEDVMSGNAAFVLPDDGTIKSQFWYGNDDQSADCYVGADEENFYFAATVRDNVHSAPNTGVSIWSNDSIQFSIGKGLPALDILYYEFGMSLADDGSIQTWCWIDPDKEAGKLEGVDCRITRNESDNTTTYYMAIPWSVIPHISYEDGMCAFSMLINENDGGGRNGYIEWGSGIGSTKNPSQFRTIVFDKRGG